MSFPLRWLARRLFDVEASGVQRTAILRRARRFLNDLVAHAAGACDPVARRVALRFRPSVRLRVYDRVVGDSSGRVAQVAANCPGMLLLALALRSEPSPDLRGAGEGLLSAVVAGRPIDRALDEAIEVWASSHHTGIRLRQARWFGAWRRLESASAPERRRLLGQHRLLVRRAGRLVNPFLLLLPPPPFFVPEDIPKAPRANARWYALLRAGPLLGASDGNDDRHAIGLCHLLSRVAPLVWKEQRVHPDTVVGSLMDFLRATNRIPTRTSSLVKLINESLLWHGPYGGRGKPTDDAPLPANPLPEWSSGSVQVTGLRDAASLTSEGTAMNHCVGRYADLVQSGTTFIYAARIGGRRLTVEVRRGPDGGFDIVQMVGTANRSSTLAEQAMLRPWLVELNRQAAEGEATRATWSTGGVDDCW